MGIALGDVLDTAYDLRHLCAATIIDPWVSLYTPVARVPYKATKQRGSACCVVPTTKYDSGSFVSLRVGGERIKREG